MNTNEYLKSNHIKELFEALTDSLVLWQPSDVIQHLQDSLEVVKLEGLSEFKYSSFQSSETSEKTNKCLRRLLRQNVVVKEKTKCQGDNTNDSKIIIFIFAPGETNNVGLELSELFNNMGYINVGQCLRARIEKESEKPISSWKISKSLLQNGDFVPEDMTLNVLLDEMKLLSSKELIIIEGYPKTEKQIEDFNNAIGIERILQVYTIDSYENECRDALLKRHNFYSIDGEFKSFQTSRKLTNYKTFTLPVLKYFQDNQKLVIFRKETNIIELFKIITDKLTVEVPDIIKHYRKNLTPITEIRNKLYTTRQKVKDGDIKFQYTLSNIIYNADQLYSINPPKPRNYKLSNIPLVLIQGAPKSGKTTIAKCICKVMKGWYHCDFALLHKFSIIPPREYDTKIQCCEIQKQLESINSFATGIILENFPKSELELRIFNEEVGAIDLQLFIDVSENASILRYLRSQNIKIETERIELTNKHGNIIKPMLDYYMKSIMPVIRYYSDSGCSFNIRGDQEIDKICGQCVDVLKSIFYESTQE